MNDLSKHGLNTAKYFDKNKNLIFEIFKKFQVLELILKLKISTKRTVDRKDLNNSFQTIAYFPLGKTINEYIREYSPDDREKSLLKEVKKERDMFMHLFYIYSLSVNIKEMLDATERNLDEVFKRIK